MLLIQQRKIKLCLSVFNNNREAGIISKKSDISTYVIDYVVDVEKEK